MITEPERCPNFKPLKNPRPWPHKHGSKRRGRRNDKEILRDLISNVSDDLQILHDFCKTKGYL